MATNNRDNSGIESVSTKIPPIAPWTRRINQFFVLVESQFLRARIKDEHTRDGHLVCALDAESMRQAFNVLNPPDATTPYTKLKNRLIQVYGVQDNEREEFLIPLCPRQLGDRLPSRYAAEVIEMMPPRRLLEVLIPGRCPTSPAHASTYGHSQHALRRE